MKKLSVVLLLSLLAALPVQAARIVLATAGKPAATIVIPAAANAFEKRAAVDLRHYVQAICGVELPLAAGGKTVAGTGLYIGKCEPTLESDFPAKDLNPETFAVHVRNGSAFLTGRYPTPTYFAAASLLENSLGVRWYAPGEEWEYVPTGKQGELAIEVKDLVSVPDTSPRVWSGHQWNDDWKTWSLRNRAVLSEVVPRRQFQNNVYRVFPASKYAKDHPEYFPLINGKRWIPATDSDRYWRPCESNPEVVRLVAEYARNWFDAHPDIDSFSVGMDDISHMCGCDNCRAMDAHPDDYENRKFSDRHYKFVNALAREIKKTHPDRYIGTLIYNIARELPVTVDKLEDNVFGFITETSAHWWAPDIKQADHDLTREWARRCKHLSRYDYFGMGGVTPRVYPHLMDEQIKFDRSLGMEGTYIEVYTFLPNTAPMIWAFSRLQWDTKQNVDKLLGEFYTNMFGPAAPTMKQYFDLLERAWNTPREGRKGKWVHRNLKVQALAMSGAEVDEGFKLLRQAARQADSDLCKQRIDSLRASLEYGSYPIKAYDIASQLAKLDLKDKQTVDQAIQQVLALGKLARERERCWEEAPKRDDLLGETLRGLGEMGYLATGQMPMLESGGVLAAMRAVDWYAENDKADLPTVLAKLKPISSTSIGSTLSGWLWVMENKPANLVQNGGFESKGVNQDKPEADWSTVGAPVKWNSWASGDQGSFKLIPGAGRDGSVAASITGAPSSACYLQSVAVKPGEKYLATAWVKGLPSGDGGANFGLRFQMADGKWHPKRDLEPSVQPTAGADGWQPLIISVTIPADAGRLVLMPGVRSQKKGTTALIDDLTLYKITD